MIVYSKIELEDMLSECWDMPSINKVRDYIIENKYKYCLDDLQWLQAYWNARIAVLVLLSQMPK